MTSKKRVRVDVAANVTQEDRIGPQVRISNYLECILNNGQGCTYVIGK